MAFEASFRFSFFMVFIVEVVWLAVLLALNYVLFRHIDNLGPWSYHHVNFFSCLVAIYDQLFLAFFAGNFWAFSETLRTGTMDFVLTKPVNSLFSVFTRYQRLASMFSVLLSVAALVYFGMQINSDPTVVNKIDFSFVNILGLMVLFALGLILRVGLEIIVGTLMFITIEGEAVNIFRLNLQQFAKQPGFIYTGPMHVLLFYVFPLALITTMPAQWIYDHEPGFLKVLILMTCLTIITWMMVTKVWKWGIDRYESASS